MSRWLTPPYVIPATLVLFVLLGWFMRTHG
ncbi:hypothetical protein M2323_004475 [Rhodoblastus acidophilus]|nr:hypothetical protein [Rhodoblastus acidophilus]MCW2335526.1 hypothetical protein [Rhodoblastus acidophilus]